MVRDGTPGESSPYRRRAKGYRNIMLPSGCRRVKLIYEDVFKAWLPDDEYREYLEYRYGYVGDSIDELYKTLPTEDTIQPRTIDSNPYRSDD